jgi:hypothetical protein
MKSSATDSNRTPPEYSVTITEGILMKLNNKFFLSAVITFVLAVAGIWVSAYLEASHSWAAVPSWHTTTILFSASFLLVIYAALMHIINFDGRK